jgi:hypothetical protein
MPLVNVNSVTAGKHSSRSNDNHFCILDSSVCKTQTSCTKRFRAFMRKIKGGYIFDEYSFILDKILFTDIEEKIPVFFYYEGINGLNYDKIYTICTENKKIKIKEYSHGLKQKLNTEWEKLKIIFSKEIKGIDAVDKSVEILRLYKKIII